jgi:hypothetical protein
MPDAHVCRWMDCLPLAQALSIEVAAISVIGCFATTRERALDWSRAHSVNLTNSTNGCKTKYRAQHIMCGSRH